MWFFPWLSAVRDTIEDHEWWKPQLTSTHRFSTWASGSGVLVHHVARPQRIMSQEPPHQVAVATGVLFPSQLLSHSIFRWWRLSHLFEQSCAGALREKLVKYRHYLELKAAERSVGEGGIGRGVSQRSFSWVKRMCSDRTTPKPWSANRIRSPQVKGYEKEVRGPWPTRNGPVHQDWELTRQIAPERIRKDCKIQMVFACFWWTICRQDLLWSPSQLNHLVWLYRWLPAS